MSGSEETHLDKLPVGRSSGYLCVVRAVGAPVDANLLLKIKGSSNKSICRYESGWIGPSVKKIGLRIFNEILLIPNNSICDGF